MEEKLVVTETNFPIGKKSSGKVRDIYDLDPFLLIVTTDRISAFDSVLPNGIPHKGEILNKLSVLWLKRLEYIIPNHFVTDNPDRYPEICRPYAELLKGRSMLVKKARPLPCECVVRGYLSGSAWNSYKKNGEVCGIKLPPGLLESSRLNQPIFTPSTKAESGHDENISKEQLKNKIGGLMTGIVEMASIDLYREARSLADLAGIIIADTKFEFGLDENGRVILIDEVLTPDSSRFWPVIGYKPGGPQPSFDKQYVRDYLLATGWDQKPPAPELPEDVIVKTEEKYLEAFVRLSRVLKE